MFDRLALTLYPLRNRQWRDARAMFILSTGRVGTVSLVEVLNLSPEIEAHHEPKPDLAGLMSRSFHDVSLHPRRYARLFAGVRAKPLCDADDRGALYAEATMLKYYAPVIAGLMPRALFLHVHRHAGGVVRSAMRRGWYAGHSYDRCRPYPGCDDPAYRLWSTWSPFEKSCWMWAAENERFLRLADSVESHRLMRVSFEDLFSPTCEAALRIFDFAGVGRPDTERIRRSLAVRHNEQQTGDFPAYEQWSEDLKRTLEQIAGPTMTKLGYALPSAGAGSRRSPQAA